MTKHKSNIDEKDVLGISKKLMAQNKEAYEVLAK